MLATPGVDVDVERWVTAHRPAAVEDVARAVTQLGGTPVVAAVTALVAGVAGWRCRRSPLVAAGVIGLCFAGEVVVEVSARLVKVLVGRPRPPFADAVVHLANSSFPAAHVGRALYAATLVVALQPPRRRRAAAAVGALLVVTVGWSRVTLGAHWLTDTLAAVPLAAVAVALPAWAVVRTGRWPRPDRRARATHRSDRRSPVAHRSRRDGRLARARARRRQPLQPPPPTRSAGQVASGSPC